MSENKDIRWIQRFRNFKKALDRLVQYSDQEDLNELEEQGLIKAFEYTYELSWKTLQDLLKDKGYEDIVGPKPVISQSFQIGLITDGEGWAGMHNSRNLTSHIYDQAQIEEITSKVIDEFLTLFLNLKEALVHEENNNNPTLF